MVLGMVEQEISHPEPLGQLAGVPYRGMVLLVGVEYVGLRVEAERLVEHPLGVLCVGTARVGQRFVAAANEPATRSKLHGEAELLGLGGADVEEGGHVANDLELLPVGDLHEVKSLVDVGRILCS